MICKEQKLQISIEIEMLKWIESQVKRGKFANKSLGLVLR